MGACQHGEGTGSDRRIGEAMNGHASHCPKADPPPLSIYPIECICGYDDLDYSDEGRNTG